MQQTLLHTSFRFILFSDIDLSSLRITLFTQMNSSTSNLAENSKKICRAIQNLTWNTLDHAVNRVKIKLKNYSTEPDLWPCSSEKSVPKRGCGNTHHIPTFYCSPKFSVMPTTKEMWKSIGRGSSIGNFFDAKVWSGSNGSRFFFVIRVLGTSGRIIRSITQQNILLPE